MNFNYNNKNNIQNNKDEDMDTQISSSLSPFITEGTFHPSQNINPDFIISNLSPVFNKNSISVIGTGRFSTVFLYKHKKTNKFYAVKYMTKENIKSVGGTLDAIYKEIDIHSRLDHKNIIKLYHPNETQKTFQFVLEYAPNGNLHNKLSASKKGLDESDAFHYFIQIANAIYFLHINDLIHRDIKPENILLGENDEVKLCDFGWCCEEEVGNRHTFCGTFEYMAPEIIKEVSYNKSVDIWALGVLLFELVYGYTPFRAGENTQDKITEILSNVLHKKINFDALEGGRGISDDCKELILNMCENDVNKRYSIKEVFMSGFVRKYEYRLFEEVGKKDDRENIKNDEKMDNININMLNNLSNSAFVDFNMVDKPSTILESNIINAEDEGLKDNNELNQNKNEVPIINNNNYADDIKYKEKFNNKVESENNINNNLNSNININLINNININENVNTNIKNDNIKEDKILLEEDNIFNEALNIARTTRKKRKKTMNTKDSNNNDNKINKDNNYDISSEYIKNKNISEDKLKNNEYIDNIQNDFLSLKISTFNKEISNKEKLGETDINHENNINPENQIIENIGQDSKIINVDKKDKFEKHKNRNQTPIMEEIITGNVSEKEYNFNKLEIDKLFSVEAKDKLLHSKTISSNQSQSQSISSSNNKEIKSANTIMVGDFDFNNNGNIDNLGNSNNFNNLDNVKEFFDKPGKKEKDNDDNDDDDFIKALNNRKFHKPKLEKPIRKNNGKKFFNEKNLFNKDKDKDKLIMDKGDKEDKIDKKIDSFGNKELIEAINLIDGDNYQSSVIKEKKEDKGKSIWDRLFGNFKCGSGI